MNMTRLAIIATAAVVLFIPSVCFSQAPDDTKQVHVGVGKVKVIAEGSLYVGGVPHSVVTFDTSNGTEIVAVPTIGAVTQPIKIGETFMFSGPIIRVGQDSIVNTHDGYVFRKAEKSMAQFQAEMMKNAQEQMEKLVGQGIPNAVPTIGLQTSEQAATSTERRRTDILLTLLSLVVALLALDRIPRLIAGPVRWFRSRFGKTRS